MNTCKQCGCQAAVSPGGGAAVLERPVVCATCGHDHDIAGDGCAHTLQQPRESCDHGEHGGDACCRDHAHIHSEVSTHECDHGAACGHDHTGAVAAAAVVGACGCVNAHVHSDVCTHEHDHGEVCGHVHEIGCGCGDDHEHGDGCGCGHEHGDTSHLRRDVIASVAAVLIAGAAYALAPIYDAVVQAVLLVAAVLVAGAPIFLQGLKNIVRLKFEERSLMTVAVVAAVIIGELPEALLVTLLFRIGGILEDLAVARSQREVDAITQIIPENANLLAADGSTRVVGARTLATGSRILVKSGERVPVDAVVRAGQSSLDTSSLTGESVPREVGPGDAVLSGTVNLGGVLTCETTNTFDNSTASKIIEMVRESAAKKGSTERLISRFARVYTPIVIALAVLVALVPPLLGFGPLPVWVSRALVFLVASCPCALVIAIPLSFFAGIGALSKNGILVKGSRYIEALAGADTVVFDKTGTLTTGRLAVSAVHTAAGESEDEVLRLAAVCENYSNHPIARAVVEAHGVPDLGDVQSCEEVTSYGMKAVIAGESVLCGSARLMELEGVEIGGLPEANVYVAKNGRALGALCVVDHPRADAAHTLQALRAAGIAHAVMLTGDGEAAARQAAGEIGIDDVRAGLLPAGKVAEFEEIKRRAGGKVLFVGDGINDSPVLAQADAGIAMGLASDAAIEAADVVLMGDRLASLPQAVGIARRTSRLARWNIAFALAVKMLVLVLAFLGMATMWMAVFADVGVTVLCVLNATRALRFR